MQEAKRGTTDATFHNKLLMVAMELVMTLFALLFAFPHIPNRILVDEDDETEDTQWFSVQSTPAFRAAVENLLQTSPVLNASLKKNKTLDDITTDTVTSLRRLSEIFGLCLEGDSVTATCRQMYENITAVYRFLLGSEIGTRDDLLMLYMRYQFLSPGYHTKSPYTRKKRVILVICLPRLAKDANEDRQVFLRFCSELTVAWMQPYFAKDQRFYLPDLLCSPASS